MKTVYIIFGNMGSGKTTCARLFCHYAGAKGKPARVLNFADPLKDVANIMLGIPREVSYGSQEDKDNYKVYGKSARHWLQQLGTDIGKNLIHPKIWADSMIRKITESDTEVTIIGDGRFPEDELIYMRDRLGPLGVKVIGIRLKRDTNGKFDLSHSSESILLNTADDQFDEILDNNDSLDTLSNNINILIDKHINVSTD